MLGTGGACTADEMGIRELQFGWLVQDPGGKGELVRGSQGRKKTANLSQSAKFWVRRAKAELKSRC